MTSNVSVVVCGVDNNPCRIAVSSYLRERQLPVISTAVSEGASHGYALVQEKGAACFACQFPKAVNDETYPPFLAARESQTSSKWWEAWSPTPLTASSWSGGSSEFQVRVSGRLHPRQ